MKRICVMSFALVRWSCCIECNWLKLLVFRAPARFVPGTRKLIVRCCLRTCYPFPLCFSMFNRNHWSSIVAMLVVNWKTFGSFPGFAVNPSCSPLGLAHGVNGQNRRGPHCVRFHGCPSKATLKHHFIILEDFWSSGFSNPRTLTIRERGFERSCRCLCTAVILAIASERWPVRLALLPDLHHLMSSESSESSQVFNCSSVQLFICYNFIIICLHL